MSRKIFCLRQVDIYKNIPEAQLIALSEDAVEMHFSAGTVFYDEDSPAAHVYVIKDGEVELYREDGGKRVVLGTLFPGDVFGDFGTGNCSHTAAATRPTYICKTPTNEFLDIVRANPQIALQLMQALAEKTEYYESRIANLQRPAKDRLLHELRNLYSKNQRRVIGKVFNIPFKISHQKLADKTGLNRVTVTKLLAELRADGSVEIDTKNGAMVIN